MDESAKDELKSMGKHALHGAEDTLDVVGRCWTGAGRSSKRGR